MKLIKSTDWAKNVPFEHPTRLIIYERTQGKDAQLHPFIFAKQYCDVKNKDGKYDIKACESNIKNGVFGHEAFSTLKQAEKYALQKTNDLGKMNDKYLKAFMNWK